MDSHCNTCSCFFSSVLMKSHSCASHTQETIAWTIYSGWRSPLIMNRTNENNCVVAIAAVHSHMHRNDRRSFAQMRSFETTHIRGRCSLHRQLFTRHVRCVRGLRLENKSSNIKRQQPNATHNYSLIFAFKNVGSLIILIALCSYLVLNTPVQKKIPITCLHTNVAFVRETNDEWIMWVDAKIQTTPASSFCNWLKGWLKTFSPADLQCW